MTTAFQFGAFQSSAFQTSGIIIITFPISGLDPNSMATLGITSTETLLYDYSNTETFYLLKKPPEINKPTLFSVPISFAKSWFRSNAGSVQILYNPFTNIVPR